MVEVVEAAMVLGLVVVAGSDVAALVLVVRSSGAAAFVDDAGNASFPEGSCELWPTWLSSAEFAAAAAPETITMLQIVAAASTFRREGTTSSYEPATQG